MICEFTRKLADDDLTRIRRLEDELEVNLIAFSCRELDPAREEKLLRIMQELGPQLQVPVAVVGEQQLVSLRALEEALGVALIAVAAT